MLEMKKRVGMKDDSNVLSLRNWDSGGANNKNGQYILERLYLSCCTFWVGVDMISRKYLENKYENFWEMLDLETALGAMHMNTWTRNPEHGWNSQGSVGMEKRAKGSHSGTSYFFGVGGRGAETAGAVQEVKSEWQDAQELSKHRFF